MGRESRSVAANGAAVLGPAGGTLPNRAEGAIDARRRPAPSRPAGTAALAALARILARQAAAEASRDLAISITRAMERAP